MTIVAAGEILWDVFEDGEHLGGATFNFCAHARRLGHNVWLASAVGDDERGRRALERMRELDLAADYVRTSPGEATGIVTVKLEAGGQPRFTIHRPAAYDFTRLDESDLERLAAFRPAWIYFGTLFQIYANGRDLVRRLAAACPAARRFYDVNLRVDCYTPALVEDLMAQAQVVKLNDAEAEAISGSRDLETFARGYARRFAWRAVCITRGAEGCALLVDGEYLEAPGYPVEVADTVGAGDAFAAAFVHGLSAGWPAGQIADFANRVGALVASRPGGVPPWTMRECQSLLLHDRESTSR